MAGIVAGKVAIVTGGGRGIGRAIALALAKEGARVVVCDIGASLQGAGTDAGPAGEVVDEIKRAGGEAIASTLSITEPKNADEIVKAALTAFGRVDILVNNAGTNIRKQPQEYSAAEWHTVLDTNLTSAFLCSAAAYPEMKKAGGGKIINIGSMMSIFGASFTAAYAASKGGIVQFTKATATAWAKDNIQVNAVLPGWIDTDLTRRAREVVPTLNDNVLRRTPAGRWGTIDDMSGIAVFLASPASDFVTGAAIPVDGGWSAM